MISRSSASGNCAIWLRFKERLLVAVQVPSCLRSWEFSRRTAQSAVTLAEASIA